MIHHFSFYTPSNNKFKYRLKKKRSCRESNWGTYFYKNAQNLEILHKTSKDRKFKSFFLQRAQTRLREGSRTFSRAKCTRKKILPGPDLRPFFEKIFFGRTLDLSNRSGLGKIFFRVHFALENVREPSRSLVRASWRKNFLTFYLCSFCGVFQGFVRFCKSKSLSLIPCTIVFF